MPPPQQGPTCRVVRADSPKKVHLQVLRTSRSALRAVVPELFSSVVTTTVHHHDGGKNNKNQATTKPSPPTTLKKKTFSVQELEAIATYVKIVCNRANVNVVVGVDDFSAFVKYRKGSLTYVVFDVKPKQLRVLIYESLREENNIDTTVERVAEAEKVAPSESLSTKKDTAVVVEGNDALPKCVETIALNALNDKNFESTSTRVMEMRKQLSENFGDFWHVIHDNNPYAVSCDRTTFTLAHIEGEKKELFFVARKGKAQFTVWHHNALAPAPYFEWFWKLNSSERMRLIRYSCLFFATGLAVSTRTLCGYDARGNALGNNDSSFCRASPTVTPILIGVFLVIAFSTSVFSRVQKNKERKLGSILAQEARRKK